MSLRPSLSLLVLTLLISGVYSQETDFDNMPLLEHALFLESPEVLPEKIAQLHARDSLTLVTFSKNTGQLLDEVQLTKEAILWQLKGPGFQDRYFVLIFDSTVLFYITD